MGSGGASTTKTGDWQAGPSGDSSNSSKCFVATACYGDSDNITNSLRRWRDEMLRNKHWRKIVFIKVYYALWGRPGGWILRKIPSLKPVARKMILFFVKINKIEL